MTEPRWGTAAKVASAAVVGVVIVAVVALPWGVSRTSGSDRTVAPAPGALVVSAAGAAGLRETASGRIRGS